MTYLCKRKRLDKTANIHVMIYLAVLFKVSYPLDLWNCTLFEKSIHGNNSFLLFSLYHVEKWNKCDRRKVRKWHVTIYFYIKRIFICLNCLFPAFCFCNFVYFNFTHKIRISRTKRKTFVRNFEINICLWYVLSSLLSMT